HRVVEDAEVEVEPRRPVPLVDQDVPERERVFAAGDGHEHVLVLVEHAVLPDRLTDLVPEEVEKVRGAERGVVAAQLEHGRPPALAALHCAPPLITGRSSIVSPSRTTWSAVISSSPRITRTVSGRMFSSRRTSFTRRPPSISTSRRGFRKMTFTGSSRAARRGRALPSRPRKPRRAPDVTNLGEMDPVVSGLELPPLRE